MAQTLLCFILAVALVTVAAPLLAARLLAQRLTRLLQQQRFDDFFRLLDSPPCRLFLRAYDREFFRLNAFSLRHDSAAVDDQYQRMLKMRMRSPEQEKKLVLGAFAYYLNLGSEPRTTALLPRVRECVTPQEFKPYEMMYSVMIRKQARYISEMEAQLSSADGLDRSVLHYMLCLQYGYLGNTDKAEEHLRLSRAESDRALNRQPAQS